MVTIKNKSGTCIEKRCVKIVVNLVDMIYTIKIYFEVFIVIFLGFVVLLLEVNFKLNF